MKTKHLLVLLIGSCLTLSNCDKAETEKVKDKVDDAGKKVGEAIDNTVDKVKEKLDETFIKNITKDNRKALEWLRAGTKMGTDAELKEIADRMIPDHEKLLTEISDYAIRKNISLDTDTSKGVQIDSKTGTSWDKNWASKMRDMHRDMVGSFERTQSNTQDHDLKDLVTNNLPMLREHLNMAEKLETRLGK